MVEIIMLLVPYVTAFIAIVSAFWLGRATAPDLYQQGYAAGVEAVESDWTAAAEAEDQYIKEMQARHDHALEVAYQMGAAAGAKTCLTHPRFRTSGSDL